MRIAIIGCGIIGQRRAKFLDLDKHKITAIIDPDKNQRINFKTPHSFEFPNVEEFLASGISYATDAVFIATSHKHLALASVACATRGMHVLVEKPVGRTAQDIQTIIDASNDCIVQVGFNHRYHPAMLKMYDLINNGTIGEVMFVRGRYGYGGRLGLEKEWRNDVTQAGGGETLEQGVHLIDLSRWILGDFTNIQGESFTYYWDIPFDDNGFMMLKTDDNKTAWLNVSATEWRNLFCFEVFGKKGKLMMDGLGGNYGLEKLTLHKVKPEMGFPETTTWEYPGEDRSWVTEFNIFEESIVRKQCLGPTLQDAKATLEVVEQIYKNSRLGL